MLVSAVSCPFNDTVPMQLVPCTSPLRFVGKFLGKDADIASGELRFKEIQTLAHMSGDYYICPRFQEKVRRRLT